MRKLLGIVFLFLITSVSAQNQQILDLLQQVKVDSVRRTIQDLEDFESRYCNQPNGNIEVARYLAERLNYYGYDAQIDSFYISEFLSFEYVDRWMYNVRARVDGTEVIDTTYIIGAHLDAIATDFDNWDNPLLPTTPGADDNASGCAAMIEVARIFAENDLAPKCNLEFMAWDGEELGLNGAYADCERREENEENEVVIVFNNDMISYQPENEGYRLKFYQYDNSVDLAQKAVQICELYTSITPTSPPSDNNEMRRYSDSQAYAQNGHHAVFTIEHYFTPYYHTEEDLIEYCNLEFAAEVTKYNLAALVLFTESLPESAAVEEFTKPQLSVYPNPVSTTLHFSDVSYNNEHSMIYIYDLYGKLLQREPLLSASIDVSSLPTGFYVIKVQAGKQISMAKFMKN